LVSDTIGREHRVGNPLRRILVVVEAGGAEAEVEVGDHGVELQVARDRPGDVVRHGRAPTPPLAPMTAITRPTGLASGDENSPQMDRITSRVPTGEIR
jgi:hypothetical protein